MLPGTGRGTISKYLAGDLIGLAILPTTRASRTPSLKSHLRIKLDSSAEADVGVSVGGATTCAAEIAAATCVCVSSEGSSTEAPASLPCRITCKSQVGPTGLAATSNSQFPSVRNCCALCSPASIVRNWSRREAARDYRR